MKVSSISSKLISGVATVALVPMLACPVMQAQTTTDHLVSPNQMQQQMQSTSETRQQNIETLNKFLSIPGADQAMRDANINPEQARAAVPTLSDPELANLAQRANHAQEQFAAGAFGLKTLLLILVIIVVIIIIATLA